MRGLDERTGTRAVWGAAAACCRSWSALQAFYTTRSEAQLMGQLDSAVLLVSLALR